MFIDQEMRPGNDLAPGQIDLLRSARCKSKVAVRTLVQRLDQHISCGSKRSGDLPVRDTGPADDINRSPQQVIAVWHSADLTVVGNRSKCARDDAECRRHLFCRYARMVER